MIEGSLSSSTPPDIAKPATGRRAPSLAERIILQIGHRVVSVGLFGFLVAGVAIYLERFDAVWQLPAVAFACADAGVLCASGAFAIASVRRARRGESVGLFIFSLLLALLSGWMMLMYRWGWWHA